MNPTSLGHIIGRFLGLSLLGVVCLSFSGVILALLFPFAIGYGAYSLYRYYARGEKPQLRQQLVEPARHVGGAAYHGCRKVTAGLAGLVGKLFRGVGWLVGTVIGGGWTLATETLGAAILGAALGVMIGMPTQTDRYLVFVGAGGGALLGLVNGISSIRSRQRMAQLRKLEFAVARAA
jgi:hypothetical protein